MPKKPTIFLSYRRASSVELALYIYARLTALGGDVFLDLDELHGQRFARVIRREIVGCDFFLIILKPDTLDSEWVRRELETALDEDKPIIPVTANDFDFAQHVPSEQAELRRYSGIPFRAEFADEAIERIADVVGLPMLPSKSRIPFVLAAIVLVTFVLGLFIGLGLPGLRTPSSIVNVSTPSNTEPVEPSNTPEPTEIPTTLPTNVPIPSETPDSRLQAALLLARMFTGGNRDWQPFLYVFPDDPAGAAMMLVPMGNFMMGSDDRDLDERPTHSQEITAPYWIDWTEVARDQYQLCVDAGACAEAPLSFYSERGTQPINRVTWFQAHDYCIWRGMRLPTEVEWEYAALGPDGWTFPWGNSPDAANPVFLNNSDNRTVDVGSHPAGASWVGALDMSGNILEWVSSLYLPYPYDQSHEDDADSSRVRVLRGGSFSSAIFYDLRSARRYSDSPTADNNSYGFRCARS